MFGVLRQRNFGLLWVGGLISIAGDWVLIAALPFFVYERTGSTVATAGMIVAELAPGVTLGSAAGVWVDRLDRRRLLIATNLLQALTVASLLGVTNGGKLWIVYAVAAAQSALASFAVPAESALLPSLVSPDELISANALTVLNNRLARLAGVPLGGLLLGMFGLGPVVIVDALTFCVAAALITGVRAPVRTPVERVSFAGEWLEGARLIRDDRTVALLFGVLGLMTFSGTMIDPLYVAWVRDVLDRGPKVYGLLLTTHAAFGIAGSVLVGTYRGIAPRVLMGWSSVAAGAALILKWNAPLVPLTFALTALGGVVSVASAIGIETWVQSTIHEDYRGRVFAALGASGAFCSLLGASVGGVAAQYVGVTAMLSIAAALVLTSGAVVLRALPAHRSGAQRNPA